MKTYQATFGFGLGCAMAVVVMASLPRFIFGFLSTNFPLIQPFLPIASEILFLIVLFSDGAIGGSFLRIGRRATWGYACGFLVAGLFIRPLFNYIRFLSGGHDPFDALFYSLTIGALSFGSAGAIGSFFVGHSTQLILRSIGGFAIGGALGGTLFVSPFLIPYPDSIILEQWLKTILPLVGFFLPHLLGGAAVGSVLKLEPRTKIL